MKYKQAVTWFGSSFLLAALLTGASCASTQPKAPAASPPAKAAGPAPLPTHTVKRAVLKRTAQLDAVVEARELQPVRLEPQTWQDFTVREAVPHGTRVKKGDTLVTLDAEKINEQIEDLEQDRPGAATSLELAVAELENLTHTSPQKLDAAKRTRRIADEELAYFDRTGRERRQKTAHMNLKNAQQRLENASEELKQLEKMYKADDLTEETEEIILKRQKVEVEFAEFWLETTRLNSERELKILIPREDESLKQQQRDQELSLALAEESVPKNLVKKRFDVEKLKRERQKAQKKLADLKDDLNAMGVRAPMDGLVFYGACENGKWTTGAVVAKKLVPGGKLAPFEVFMTVVNPDRLQLKALTPEAELGKVTVGMTGEASLVSAPDRKLAVKVEKLDPIPLVIGGFETVLSLPTDATSGLVPGLNCKVTLNPLPRPAALLVPLSTVFTDGDRKHVYVLKSGGGHEQRTVKTGESDGKLMEIVDGLSEGDKILLTKPE